VTGPTIPFGEPPKSKRHSPFIFSAPLSAPTARYHNILGLLASSPFSFGAPLAMQSTLGVGLLETTHFDQ